MEGRDKDVEWVRDLQHDLEQVRKLMEEESKLDPETEPYRSKYKAREVLESMKKELAKRMDEGRDDGSVIVLDAERLRCMHAVVLYQTGIIGMDTEELATGQEMLTQCLAALNPGEEGSSVAAMAAPMSVLPAMAALNQLGVLWAQRNDPQQAQEYLENAERLYETYTSEVCEPPYDMAELFRPELEPWGASVGNLAKLEAAFTHSLYYLAQVHGNLGNNHLSVRYCHRTLRRQLESGELDPVEWALNAATLSQCFLSRDAFKPARHHLSAAICVLDRYAAELGADLNKGWPEEGQAQEQSREDEEKQARCEAYRHRRADVCRCWSKFGLLLLSYSKERLLKMAEEEDPNEEECKGDEKEQEKKASSEQEAEEDQMCFPSLELSSYEDQMTYKPLRDYDDARLVFLETQRYLKEAQEYYSMEDHASDHVQIVQDLSQAYKHLAFFENSDERQCRMHKRRVDLLEPVVKELNPTYYLLICRQLWFELGEILSDMMDLKLQRLREDPENQTTPHVLQKINRLALQSLEQFEAFINSLRETSTNNLPETFSDDTLRPALVAYFHVGRLHGKIINPEPNEKLDHMTKSYESYKKIVDYCEKHAEAAKIMSPELEVCQEMVSLLPIKIERTREQITVMV